MINDVAKSIIRDFESDIFVETGFFRGSTAVVIRSWFKDLEIVEVEINPIYCQYGREIFRNDPNTKIIQSDSKAFLKSNIDYFKKYNNHVFYLDAHWDPENWPLRSEIENICRLSTPIIIIDDFKTPNEDGTISSRHGYDSYAGVDCDKEYILDLISPHTDTIFYAREPTVDGQGSAIIFVNRNFEDINERINLSSLIAEKL